MEPLNLTEWLRIGEFLLVLLTSLVLIARWTQKVEHRDFAPALASTNGVDQRLRNLEGDVRQLKEAGENRERRLDELHQKASDQGDTAQAFVGEMRNRIDHALEQYVTKRECDAKHTRAYLGGQEH